LTKREKSELQLKKTVNTLVEKYREAANVTKEPRYHVPDAVKVCHICSIDY